jgi:hypothetical protein
VTAGQAVVVGADQIRNTANRPTRRVALSWAEYPVEESNDRPDQQEDGIATVCTGIHYLVQRSRFDDLRLCNPVLRIEDSRSIGWYGCLLDYVLNDR